MGFFSRWLAHEIERDAQRRQYHYALDEYNRRMAEVWRVFEESDRQMREAKALMDRAEALQRGEVASAPQSYQRGALESVRYCTYCGFPMPLGATPKTCPYCHREEPREA